MSCPTTGVVSVWNVAVVTLPSVADVPTSGSRRTRCAQTLSGPGAYVNGPPDTDAVVLPTPEHALVPEAVPRDVRMLEVPPPVRLRPTGPRTGILVQRLQHVLMKRH